MTGIIPIVESSIDVFLQPGEYWFGCENTRIRTLLGSCVAITLWNAKRKLGTMCHIMLPHRGLNKSLQSLDGRYANEAMALMLKDIKRAGCRPVDFEAKLFGGGSMLSSSSTGMLLAERNIEAARQLIKQNGLSLVAEHIGGRGHRQLRFDIATGEVWMRYTALHAAVKNS